MKDGIFISYRREGGSLISSVLYDALKKYFFAANVFKDVNTLIPGSDYKTVIDAAISKSSVLLILIDKNWVSHTLEDGTKRLFVENDPVRNEIMCAIENNLEVIPVLFDNGKVPQRSELPEILHPICDKHFFTFNTDSVMQDIEVLINHIKSKRKFLFEENTITGNTERFLNDPIGRLSADWKQNAEIFKKDFNYLKNYFKKKLNKE